MLTLPKWTVLLLALGASLRAQAFDYYVYPIGEIEGLNVAGKTSMARPLIDVRMLELFSSDVQKKLLGEFDNTLASAYPTVIVHPSQVRDVKTGHYVYLREGVVCGQGSFSVPVSASYAMVLGITRVSKYTVDKGANVEVLIPITLNVQVIKADQSKVAYVASSTQYTTLVVSKAELSLKATDDMLTKAVLGNTVQQIRNLVSEVKEHFNPQQTPVRLTHKVQDYWVTDKGYSVGFNVGDELEASDATKPDQDALVFKVISTNQSYTVLKAQSGKPQVGSSYEFVFSSLGSDGNKPRVMPVYATTKEALPGYIAADLFSKNIGFNAPFTLAPVDVNFADTMSSIRAQTCAPWDKIPASKQVFESRTDAPAFFVRFGVWNTPLFVQAGAAGVNTEEKFGTLVAGTLVDKSGNVIFSEMGSDLYLIKRTSGVGLALTNAMEISNKNAVVDLTKRFLKNVKFDYRDYVISQAQPGKFIVQGLAVNDGQDITFEVLHPLGIKIGTEQVMVKLAAEAADAAPQTKNGDTLFSYRNVDPANYPSVGNGDIFRIVAASRAGVPDIASCGPAAAGSGSLAGDFLVPVIENAVNHANNFNVQISDKEFYANTNDLLHNGFYKLHLATPAQPQSCFRAGYVFRVSDRSCGSEGCTAKVVLGLRATIQGKDGVLKDAIAGETLQIAGAQENQVENLAGYQALQSSTNVASELLKRLNAK